MILRDFDIGLTASGYPVDDQHAFGAECCSAVAVFFHLIRKSRLRAPGFAKLVLLLDAQQGDPLRVDWRGLSVLAIRLLFDFKAYSRQNATSKTHTLGDVCARALRDIFANYGIETNEKFEALLREIQAAHYDFEIP